MTPLLSALFHRLPIGWLQLVHNRTRLAAALAGVAFSAAGPGAFVAFVLNGGIAFLTALSFAELAALRQQRVVVAVAGDELARRDLALRDARAQR